MRADDRAKFKTRASRCSHCPELTELDPPKPDTQECKVFGWEIGRDLAKKQAVCRTDDKQRGIMRIQKTKECDEE